MTIGASGRPSEHVLDPPDAAGRVERVVPAVGPPGPGERGEDLERRAPAGEEGPRRHRVGRPDRPQLDLVLRQRGAHLVVTLGAVGPGVVRDVHRLGAGLAGHVPHGAGGGVPPDDEVPAGPLVQLGQAAGEEPAAVGAGRGTQVGVVHEQGDDAVVLPRRLDQRRVVPEPQVAPEPHDRGGGLGHPAALPQPSVAKRAPRRRARRR
jgi:hypothetical protein